MTTNFKPTLFYCYDAYCGWCYGNSKVMQQVNTAYAPLFNIEVLSGGMVMPQTPQPISVTASYIQQGYKRVEEYTGIQFGEDYLWHIFNADKSDWFPNSLKPAVALCIVKEMFPQRQIAFATDLLYALHYEGRDLCDDEAYRHLLEKYTIDADAFYVKLKNETYQEKARYEFALCKQLQVSGYPTMLLQTAETKFYLVSNGYTAFENIQARIENILKELMES
jgi:putative protein-disulfide isomerase